MPKVEDSKRHLVAAFVAFIDRWASIGFSFFKKRHGRIFHLRCNLGHSVFILYNAIVNTHSANVAELLSSHSRFWSFR